ncbi:N-glycosyltransferase [Shimia sp. SK013]|uniref:glycosyltransferase n=1 Tax=Shimia sp. SK013 TaxID=1389006 RepID=UPI0006B66BC4|nr:glycosyltransferase [Shimia sp. SK013]KPA21233.1 N-glycosyltransferase [Shimia sp. SK013]
MLSIIIPAHNEAERIDACLQSVLSSSGPKQAQVIVVANGCDDETAPLAQMYQGVAEDRGWHLDVLDMPAIGKPGALNQGDHIAHFPMRTYLDADVVVDRDLFAQICAVLNTKEPRYASGQLRLAPAKSWATRAYARIYQRVPFITDGVPGAGLFAVNGAGRHSWVLFPKIIADDTYVRLSFPPEQRIAVPAGYDWPLVEGFRALVKVRRRQNAGVAEVVEKFPYLLENDDKHTLSLWQKLRMGLRDPLGMLVYGAVAVIVKLTPQKDGSWGRGR